MTKSTTGKMAASALAVGALSVALLAGCSGEPASFAQNGSQPTPSVLSQASELASFDGGTAKAYENKLFVVLDSDSHEGYDWNNRVEGTGLGYDLERVTEIESFKPDSFTLQQGRSNADIGGVRTMVFEGTGAGTSKIILTYKHAREITDDDKLVVIQVETDEAGNILSAECSAASRSDDEFASSAVVNTLETKPAWNDTIISNRPTGRK